MASHEKQSKAKRVLKRVGITLVVLLALLGFGFIEGMTTGANLANPDDALIWLMMVLTDMAVMVILIRLIRRI